MMKTIALLLVVIISVHYKAKAEDGYRLWLRYDLVSDQTKLSVYKKSITGVIIEGESPTLAVVRKELQFGLTGLLGNSTPSIKASSLKEGNIIAGTITSSPLIASLKMSGKLIDSAGIGFDRTESGSNALSQYHPMVQNEFSNIDKCPEKYLLWFHHVGWNHKLKSNKSLWSALCHKYYQGVDSVRWMQQTWNSLTGKVDADRHGQVKMLLSIQEKEAVIWRNSCVLYFQTFSKQPILAGLELPKESLDYYQNLEFPFAPGIKPKW